MILQNFLTLTVTIFNSDYLQKRRFSSFINDKTNLYVALNDLGSIIIPLDLYDGSKYGRIVFKIETNFNSVKFRKSNNEFYSIYDSIQSFFNPKKTGLNKPSSDIADPNFAISKINHDLLDKSFVLGSTLTISRVA